MSGYGMPTFRDTALRLAAKYCDSQFWDAPTYARYHNACRVAGLDPITVLRDARLVSA